MAQFDLERMAKEVAQHALTDTLYDGKTLQEWIEVFKEWRTPTEPSRCESSGTMMSTKVTFILYSCGACGGRIEPGDAYCRRCGKAIRWNEDEKEVLFDLE